MVHSFEKILDIIFHSSFFAVWLSGFMVLIACKISFIILRYLELGNSTFQKEPDTQEEITYENLYDDELLELMAKYDEMDSYVIKDKKHKKKKGKK